MDTADIEEFQHPSNLTMCLEAIESSVSFSSFFQAEMDNFFNQDENLIKPEEGEVLVERKIKSEPPDDWSKLSPSDMCFSSSEVTETDNKTLLYTGNTQIKTESGRMPLSPSSSSTRIIKKAKKKRKKNFPEIDRDSHFQDDTDAMRLGYTLNVQSDVPCETEPGEVTPLELVAVSVKTECKRENQKFSADTETLNPSQLYDGKGQVKASKKNEEKIISKILKFKSGQPLENDRQLLLADYYCSMPVRELNSDTGKNASQENGVQNHEQDFHDLKVNTERDIDIPGMKKKRKKRKFTNCNANINSQVSDEALKRRCLRPCYVDLSKKPIVSDNDLNITLSNEVKINKKKIKKFTDITENNGLYSGILENDNENNDKQSADQDTDLEVSENVEESRDSDTFNAESSIADSNTENDSKKSKQVSTETDPRQNHNSNENSKNDRKKIYKHKISRFELESLCKDSGLNVSEIESDNVCEINNGIRRRSVRRRSQKVSNLSESHNWFSGLSESDSESDENLVEEGPDFEVSESDTNAEASDSDSEIPSNHSNRKWHSFYNKQNVPESGEKPTVSQNGNYNSSHLRSILLSKPARSKKPSKNAVWFKDHYQSLVAKNGSNLQASLLDLRRSSLNKKSSPWSWLASACSSAQNKFTPMQSRVNPNIPASLSDVSPAGLHSNPAPTSESEIPVNETQRVFPYLFTRRHPGLAVGSIPNAAVSRPVSHTDDLPTSSDSFTILHPGLAVGSIPNAAVSRPVYPANGLPNSKAIVHPDPDLGPPVSPAKELLISADSQTSLCTGTTVGSTRSSGKSQPVSPANGTQGSSDSQTSLHPVRASSSVISQSVSPAYRTQGSSDSQTSLHPVLASSSVISQSLAPANGIQLSPFDLSTVHPGLPDVSNSSSAISQPLPPDNEIQEMPSECSERFTTLNNTIFPNHVPAGPRSPCHLPLSKSTHKDPQDSTITSPRSNTANCVWPTGPVSPRGRQYPLKPLHCTKVSSAQTCLNQGQVSAAQTCLNQRQVSAAQTCLNQRQNSSTVNSVSPTKKAITWYPPNTIPPPTGPVSPRERQYPLKPLHCTKVPSAQTCLKKRQVSSTQTCLNQRQVSSRQTCLKKQKNSSTVNRRKKKILTGHPPKTTPRPLNAEDDKSVKNDLFKLATSCEENVLAHFTQTGSQQEQRKLKTLLEKVQLRNWNLIESETEPEEANPVLYQCEERYCKKIFACEIKFARHMRKHKRKYICEICGKYFQNFTKMMCHVGNHSKKFKCTICDTEWSTRYNLRAHMLSHTGEKPYTCDGCGKGFARIDNYRSHMKKLHPDLPRYSCAECKEKFETLDEEKQHKKKVHPVIKVTKVYPCPHCGRNFGLQRKLKGHVKLHDAGVFDRKYSCKICKRSFNLKTAYTNHMIRHRIGGMLTCEICKVTFGLTKLRRKFVLKDDNGSQDVCEQCYFEWLKEQDPKNFSEMYRQARC